MPEKLTHHTTMEVIWTIIPTIIVLSIAVPSLTLIYSLDQHADRPGEVGLHGLAFMSLY
jgi:heme/copper-type cytochrome/quinol oxidase subunit 2